MKKIFLYSAPIAAGFAALTTWILAAPPQMNVASPQEYGTSPNDPQTQLKIEQLQSQLSDLQTKQADLLNLVLKNKGGTPNSAADSNISRDLSNSISPLANNEVNQNKSDEDLEQKAQTRFSRLENSFLSEERDPSWSLATEQTLKTMMTGKSFPGTQLVQSECRTKACVLDVAYSDRDAMDGFFSTFPNKLGWSSSGESKIVHESEGEIRVRIFISRDADKLPGV